MTVAGGVWGWGPGRLAVPWFFKLTTVFNDGESFNYSSPFFNPFNSNFDNLFIQWEVPIVGGTSPLFKCFLTLVWLGAKWFRFLALDSAWLLSFSPFFRIPLYCFHCFTFPMCFMY